MPRIVMNKVTLGANHQLSRNTSSSKINPQITRENSRTSNQDLQGIIDNNKNNNLAKNSG